MKQQSGFSAVELILILAVVGVIGAVGWMVFGKNKKSDSGQNNTTTQPIAAESGTCFGVSKATIKSILGAPAENLQDLSDTGGSGHWEG